MPPFSRPVTSTRSLIEAPAPRPLALLHHSASTIATVQRDTHTVLSSSSVMRTSHTWLLRPTCAGIPTAVSVPLRLGLTWLALISDPKATFPGGQFKKAPVLATLSASTALTPP